jgi:aminomethyltransferase
LRLEVCYPLHGNDITAETDPISAALDWVCDPDKSYTGGDAVRAIRQSGPARRLVAFVMEDRAVPRAGMAILPDGRVTSGTHSPSLDVGIGLGYVAAESAEPGHEITIDVRGRPRRARIVEKPIYQRKE